MADAAFDSDDPEQARRLVKDARSTTAGAIGDLRSVVRGIHPPVLADRGLAGAVAALAIDMAIPVTVDARLPGRPPAPVESAVYFGVAECLANVGKHSGARHGWIRLVHEDGVLRAVVGDDGRGGADPGAGTGMLGVMRRLAAFDGTTQRLEPGRRPDHRHPGGSVRLVLAEDHALLRAGLIQLLEGNGFTILHAVDNAPALDAGAARPGRRGGRARRTPAADADRRRPARGDRRTGGAAGLPGDGAVAVRRAALRPRAAGQRRGRGRLPAQGPGLRRRGVRRRRTTRRRGRHRARPRGGRHRDGPPARRAAGAADRRASARCSG